MVVYVVTKIIIFKGHDYRYRTVNSTVIFDIQIMLRLSSSGEGQGHYHEK